MSSVDASGPLFDGRAARALAQAEDATAERGGQYARDRIQQIVRDEGNEVTGYYESNLQLQRASNTSIVTDRGVAYGPWLEGSSSRNNSTGFHGFHAFRRVVEEMDTERVLPQIYQEEFDRRRGDMQ